MLVFPFCISAVVKGICMSGLTEWNAVLFSPAFLLRSVQLNVCHALVVEKMVVDGVHAIGNIYLIFNWRAKGHCKHIIVHILLYPLKIKSCCIFPCFGSGFVSSPSSLQAGLEFRAPFWDLIISPWPCKAALTQPAELHLISCAQTPRISPPGCLERAPFRMLFQDWWQALCIGTTCKQLPRDCCPQFCCLQRQGMNIRAAAIISGVPIILHHSGSPQIYCIYNTSTVWGKKKKNQTHLFPHEGDADKLARQINLWETCQSQNTPKKSFQTRLSHLVFTQTPSRDLHKPTWILFGEVWFSISGCQSS